MTSSLRLISHVLCPYVQRAVTVATEHGIRFERVDIDLANKPDWFLAISPTGKTPLLLIERRGARPVAVFESAVIAEYLDEISGAPMLPDDSLERARHRAWIEFASATLNNIGQLYSAIDHASFEQARSQLRGRLEQVEKALTGPWFGGATFGLVDAAFGPALRYLDAFRAYSGLDLTEGLPAIIDWAALLASRKSIREAVTANYPELLVNFVRGKGSFLGMLLREAPLAA
jgi:glutathione S-transferase